jgi:tetratricopeptide (TPR) repeat protein
MPALVSLTCPSCDGPIAAVNYIDRVPVAQRFDDCLRRCETCGVAASNAAHSQDVTFIYRDPLENIPIASREGVIDALSQSLNLRNRESKRSRFGFTTSEDALTWVVFTGLNRQSLERSRHLLLSDPRHALDGSKTFFPVWLSLLARAYGELGQFDQAWSHIGEAITMVETTKETWYEADVHRIAGEIALMSPEPDAAKAEACFERAFAIARAQQAKSFELRAAMSMARLWRDQAKRDEARELLAPVYGWFTEGFDTLDLKQAKALLDELT